MKTSLVKSFFYVGVLTFALWFNGGAQLLAQDKPIKLLYGTFDPPKAVFSEAAKRWGKELEAMTNGRVKVDFSWAMAKPGELYDLTKKGIIDIGLTIPVFSPGLFPLFQVVGLPFVIPTAEIGSKALNAYIDKGYVDKEHENVKVLFSYTVAADSIFTRKKSVTKMENIKGLKIHAGGPENSKRIELMGGVPVFIPYPEMYGAFQKGIIDGMVMGFAIMEIFRLFEVTQYAMEPPMGTGAVAVVMNKRKWNQLPANIQGIMDDLSKKHYIEFARAWDRGCDRGKKLFLDAGGKINELNPAELKKVSKAIEPIWEHWITAMEKKGMPGRMAVKDMYKIIKDLGVENPAVGYTLDH
jgi:TRAP-type C4-dicarboxylate transport system substrate-binding protein